MQVGRAGGGGRRAVGNFKRHAFMINTRNFLAGTRVIGTMSSYCRDVGENSKIFYNYPVKLQTTLNSAI